jgi:acyl-[acyl-carrier-protein]-phospholipid O-acyltransferase / long-chain-fatty-acid--[acyl-carrier-protein] ligase
MHENYLLRPVVLFLLHRFVRLKITGLEHFHEAGDRCVIICNHQSYLDPLILGAVLPEKPAFAINIFQADKWYFRWLDKVATLYKLDPSKPMVMKSLIQDLRKGSHKVVIFPEGRITTSGGIMKVYEGTSKIVEKTGATILPIRIDGAEYSKFSRMERFLKQRWRPQVRVTVLPPYQPLEEGKDTPPHMIYDMMADAAFAASDYRRSLLSVILESYARDGGDHVVASDISRVDMKYKTLFLRSFVLSEALAKPLQDQRYVAVLLPNSLAVAATFVSLQMMGKIPCMLNFSSGKSNILHGCKIAGVKTVLTSRMFMEKAGLEEEIEALKAQYHVIFLEDVRETIGLKHKLTGLYKSKTRNSALRHVLANTKADDPAVILYTSGSEGVPKGVALSHANILSNIYQSCSRLDLRPSDVVFNALPTFHSFGLTIGLLMPLVRGIKTFLYPSPLHYRVVPDLLYDVDATIMLGTDTFYRGYARYADPYDFWNIRLAVAGAEKLKDSTRQLYWDKYDLTIMEGYGVTETSPVLSVNTPMHHKHGTVGRIFPGIATRLEPVEGLDKGGKLHIKGPNVMLGYLNPDAAGDINYLDGWYDTGDIVTLDEENYITIQGRAKRFAKIGGEMVSLMMVENLASVLDNDSGHAAITAPDEKKGEHVVLYSESNTLSREQLIKQAGVQGISELHVPKHVVQVDEIPRLGNGKIDYVTLQKMHGEKR